MIFKIKPKISKYYSNKKRILNISVDCVTINIDKMIKILELFHFENTIIITDLEKSCRLFEEFKNKKIHYTTSIPREKNVYVETIVMLSNIDKNILNSIVETHPEVIFIYNLKKSVTWNQLLYNSRYLQSNKRINTISDLHFEFIFKENQIYISYNTEIYNSELIIEKIKQIVFDNS